MLVENSVDVTIPQVPGAKTMLTVSSLWGDGRGRVLLTIAGGWALTIGGRMIYPVLLPYLRRAYGFGLSTTGVLLTVLFLAYALGQLPGGLLADSVGEKTTLVASMLVSAGAVVLMITVRSTLFLALATTVFGFGIGLYAIARFTALRNVYPDTFGTAIGITNASSEIGQAVLPPVAGVLAVSAGWQFGFGFTIPLFAVLAVAIWVVVPERSTEETEAVETFSVETGRYVLSALRQQSVVLGVVVFILGISIWQVFTGFYPTYLDEVKGLSPTTASFVFGLYFALAALMHPLSGRIYDRWGVRQTFVVVVGSIAGFVALTVVEGVWAIVGVTVLLSMFIAFATAMESYLVETLPDDIEGTGFGVLRTVSFALGAFSPVVFGSLAERGYFDELFLVLAVCTCGMVLIATRLPGPK